MSQLNSSQEGKKSLPCSLENFPPKSIFQFIILTLLFLASNRSRLEGNTFRVKKISRASAKNVCFFFVNQFSTEKHNQTFLSRQFHIKFHSSCFRALQYWLFQELQNFSKFICCCMKLMVFLLPSPEFICTLIFREIFYVLHHILFLSTTLTTKY